MFKTDADIRNKALLIGDDFPIIKNILEEKLGKKDCLVFHELDKDNFDYILIFGAVKQKKQILSQLKNGGRILQIILESQVEKTSFPFFVLDLEKAVTSDLLAKKILKRLFSEKPHLILGSKKPKKKVRQKPFLTPKKKIIISFLSIIIFPWLFFLATLFLGINDLKGLQKRGAGFLEREKMAERADFEIKLAKKSGDLLADLIRPILKNESQVIKESLIIIENLAKGGKEAVNLEKMAKEKNVNLLKKDNNFKDYGYLKIKSSLVKIQENLLLADAAQKKLAPFKDSFLLKRYWSKLEEIPKLKKMIDEANELLELIPEALAFDKEKKYLLLLQNNFELRPTGGFIGSFAVLTFRNGSFAGLDIEDVYSADGQLKGRVEPPKPIANILNQPNWYLRDSNWDPDFAISSQQAEWFLQKETGQKFDGVIGIDLYFLTNILDVLGGVYVPDYEATVDGSNFFYKLQTERENDFFAGSSKKKDLLSALSSAIVTDFQDRKEIPWGKLAVKTYQSLEEKHLLVFLHHKKNQEIIEKLWFGGRILSTDDDNADYFMLVEANLGVNKVNYYVERSVEFSLAVNDKEIEKKVRITILNNKKKEAPNSLYKNYLRVFLPGRANLIWVKANGRKLDLQNEIDILKYKDKTSIGLLSETTAGTKSLIEFFYQLPIEADSASFRYQFLIQKQPGIEVLPISFEAENSRFFKLKSEEKSAFTEEIRKDKLVVIDFERAIK